MIPAKYEELENVEIIQESPETPPRNINHQPDIVVEEVEPMTPLPQHDKSDDFAAPITAQEKEVQIYFSRVMFLSAIYFCVLTDIKNNTSKTTDRRSRR